MSGPSTTPEANPRTSADNYEIRRAIMGTRLVIAAGGLLAPRLLARIFGVSIERGSAIPYLIRLFAVRDALMAYQLYQAPPEELEEVLRQGILTDGVDVVAALASFLRGDISLRTFVMGGGVAAAVAGAGYVARPGS